MTDHILDYVLDVIYHENHDKDESKLKFKLFDWADHIIFSLANNWCCCWLHQWPQQMGTFVVLRQCLKFLSRKSLFNPFVSLEATILLLPRRIDWLITSKTIIFNHSKYFAWCVVLTALFCSQHYHDEKTRIDDLNYIYICWKKHNLQYYKFISFLYFNKIYTRSLDWKLPRYIARATCARHDSSFTRCDSLGF